MTDVFPPTGDQYEISSDGYPGYPGYTAIITQSGALRVLRYGDTDLVAGFAEDALPDGGAGQLLVPWANRIRDGRYTWDGAEHQLSISEPGKNNASHGLVRWSAWNPLAHVSDHVTLGHRLLAHRGYPWTLDLEVTYALGTDGLTVTQRATNRGATTAPYACGAHPYLTVGSGPVDTWTLDVPASLALRTDERSLPTGQVAVDGTDVDFREPRPIDSTVLDTCYGDLDRESDGRARARISDGDRAVELWVDEHFPWLMVYSADGASTPRHALAIEPMSAPVDAFNSGTDVVRLDPDAMIAMTWGIALS